MTEETSEGLEPDEVINIVKGTVPELKDELKDRDFSHEELQKILRSEQALKNRKTAKNFINKQINALEVKEELNGAEEDIEELEQHLNNIEDIEGFHTAAEASDLNSDKLLEIANSTVEELEDFLDSNKITRDNLETLLSIEKDAKNRQTAINLLERRIEKRKGEEKLEEAEDDLEKFENDLENLDPEELSEEALDDKEDETKSEEKDEETTDVEEEESEDEADEEPEEEREDEAEPETQEERDSEESNSEEDEVSELEKKKEIAEGLELPEGVELEEISLEDLKELENEKQEREEIIQELMKKGLDEEDLRNTSTSDLETIKEEMSEQENSSEEESSEDSEEEEEEQDSEELKEEAEHDLEMLMGAVKDKSDGAEEDSGPDPMEQLRDVKSKVRNVFNRGGDDSGSEERIKAEDVTELLEDYRQEDKRKAAIKTAQIMKGYLEYSKGIEREMTYMELSENLESDSEAMDKLKSFFERMNKDQYTGNIREDDIDEVIDCAEEVVNTG